MSSPDMSVRAARILSPDMVIFNDDAGHFYARSPHPLGPYPDTLTECLDHWAARAPDRTFLASRDPGGQWRRLTYAAARRQVRSVAESLLQRRLSVNKPVLILSGNSIEHAVLALAAMYVGVPYAPVAPSYSLLSNDFQTLGAIWASMRPGLVFAGDGLPFEHALASQPSTGAEIVTVRVCTAPGRLTLFDELLARVPTAATDDAHAHVGPDTIAKILFTSGSTGTPKGVINTQRMLSANQEQIRTSMAFLADEPPVLCDWLPWNHTFGGNHNFGLTLYNGGTLYIDAGTPTPTGFSTTLSNLREIATTAYFNVPKGYEMLLPALRRDTELRQAFFSQLKMLFYAAAGLRQQVADEIEALAVDTCGERIPWVTGLGATESAPLAIISGPMAVPVAGRIGVPVPGVELKVAPVGGVFEARLRGPNITPGYWRDEEQTRAAFDSEGFYCMGDVIGFVDPAAPACGFTFQGRMTEDFKLSTGTWVRVGPLRAALVAHFGDLVLDLVVAGHDRDEVALLVFPNMTTCRSVSGHAAGVPASQVLAASAVRGRFESALTTFAAMQAGSSTRVERAMLLEAPPSIDAQEITDKGSINQKAVLRHRAVLVDILYGAGGAGPSALLIDVSGRGSHS
jgi:feruloyl-CoA synthase